MAIRAFFPEGTSTITAQSLHQWDYGQTLEIEAQGLPLTVAEVHFACIEMDEALVSPCNFVNGIAVARIPDKCLEQATAITAWVYDISGTCGTTVKTVKIPVVERARPSTTSADIPQEISNRYTELITEVNEAVGALMSGDVTAAHAENARNAEGADYASNAGHADRATSADFADQAETCAEADYTNNAGHATTADRATSADFADRAETCAEADYANNAGHATTADKVSLPDWSMGTQLPEAGVYHVRIKFIGYSAPSVSIPATNVDFGLVCYDQAEIWTPCRFSMSEDNSTQHMFMLKVGDHGDITVYYNNTNFKAPSEATTVFYRKVFDS